MSKTRIITTVLTLFICFVFIQSLFFKFAGSPETDHIFSTLDSWAKDTFELAGLFAPGGIFSAYVIGSAELVASLLLLVALFMGKPGLQGFGGLMATGIMTGAISFHLFTPLGVEVVNEATGVEADGGTLFIMACLVWSSGLALAWINRVSLPIVGGLFGKA